MKEYSAKDQPWFGELPSIDEVVEDRVSQLPLVVLTAAAVELNAVLRRLTPLDGLSHVAKINEKGVVYYAGKLGRTPAAVAMCSSQGSGGRDGSQALATKAIARFRPAAVVMVGIAFGLNEEKSSIGDVLVSDPVVPYEHQRVGQDSQPVRSVPAKPGKTLLSRFKSIVGWRFLRPDGESVSIRIGPLLSGEKLVDDPKFKAQLTKMAPEAVGGEMEAWGLYAAADNADVEWIVVKSICDWADGLKDKKHQALAAATATDLVVAVFSDATVLTGLLPTDGLAGPTKNPSSVFWLALLSLVLAVAGFSFFSLFSRSSLRGSDVSDSSDLSIFAEPAVSGTLLSFTPEQLPRMIHAAGS